jgi:MFS transporter, Spinster family, sphingosine-1-phosphate transporter
LADDARASGREGTGLFVLLCVFNLLNYIDRAAITGLLDPIRRDFGATDAQLGYIGGAFLVTYATLPTLFGWLGDRIPRTSIIAASAAFWSIATAATALATRVWQLIGMRAAVGVGEASYMANSPSLIMDLFTPAKRGRAMSVFYIASPVGSALGVALGGLLWVRFGWRGACAIVGLPGLIAAALMAMQREPVRGRFDADAPAPIRRSIGATLRDLVRNRQYVLLTIAYGGLVFTQNAIEYYLPTVLQRDKQIAVPEANAMYGEAVFIAGIVGPLIGVAIADLLRRRDRNAYYHVAALMSALVTVPLMGVIASKAGLPLSGSVFGEALLGNASIGIILTLIVGAVAPEMRATATAVSLTSVHVIGDIVSIPLVGRLSTVLQHARSTDPIWGTFRTLGLDPSHHLSAALIGVTAFGALAAATMFLVAAQANTRALKPVANG